MQQNLQNDGDNSSNDQRNGKTADPVLMQQHVMLWSELQTGNEQALYKLYHTFYDHLYHYCVSVSFDKELSKDAINSVFTDLWQKHAKLPSLDNVKGYVFICCKRKMFHLLKEQKSGAVLGVSEELLTEQQEASYEEVLIALESNEARRKLLLNAMEKLSPRQKEFIRMRYFEEMDYEEIANKTNTTVRTIYNTIHSALARLKEELGDSALLAVLLMLKKF